MFGHVEVHDSVMVKTENDEHIEHTEGGGRDRVLSDLDAQLEQLTVDSRSTHPMFADCISRMSLRTAMSISGWPTPIRSKACTMATHNGIGVQGVQHRPLPIYILREKHPEHAIRR